MEHQDQYRFYPYRPDAMQGAALFAVLAGLLVIFAEGYLLAWLLAILAAGKCIHMVLLHFIQVEASEQGIRISQWKDRAAEFSSWEEFSQAYILDVAWTTRGRYSRRYCAYYLLLTRYPVSPGTVRELGMNLAGARPRGKWKDHVALRLSEEQAAGVRRCIGETLSIVEKKIDRDEAVRL